MDNFIETIIKHDMYNEYIYVDTYCDEDYTGTDSKRPQFKRLLQDIALNKVNMLVVTDLSRLSRNTSESIHYVQVLFVTLNIRFISTQLPCLDSYLEPDKIYSMEVPMQSMMNENHAAETSFKVRRTFDNARKNGKFIGAFAGYGWEKDPKDKHKLILDLEAFEVLQMMKSWVLAGDSASIVQKKLNDLNIPSPAGYKLQKGKKYTPSCPHATCLWSTESVKKIMLRPENVGDLIQGRYKVISYKIHKQIMIPKNKWFVCKGAIPAIYTHDEQQLITSTITKATRVVRNKQVYLFSGFLTCADCGKSISRKTSKDKVYYNCRTYRTYGVQGCSAHTIKHEELEEAVLRTIQKQIEVVVDLQQVFKIVNKATVERDEVSVLKKSIKDRKEELSKIAVYKQTLYEDWKNGDISQAEYHSMKSNYTSEEKRLETILVHLEAEKKDVEEKELQCPFFNEFLKYKNIQHLSRSILVDLIDGIIIHEHKNITIHFRFMDDYKRIIDALK